MPDPGLPDPILPSDVRAVVFDAYGTLFDVNSAVARHAGAIGPDAAAFSDLWRVKQLEYTWVLTLAGRFEDFWTLTRRALEVAFETFPTVDAARLRGPLLAAYRTLDAYPDAGPALARLRARGVRTAILSNGESAMLVDAVRAAGIGVQLDGLWSVDDVGVFKPHPAVYALVVEGFGVDVRDVAFVSSNRWDVAGAAAFGFRAVWVNRAGRPDEYPGLEPVATLRARPLGCSTILAIWTSRVTAPARRGSASALTQTEGT